MLMAITLLRIAMVILMLYFSPGNQFIKFIHYFTHYFPRFFMLNVLSSRINAQTIREV